MYTPDYGKNPQRMVIDCEFTKVEVFFSANQFFCFVLFFFETGSCCVTQTGLGSESPYLGLPSAVITSLNNILIFASEFK
jgi:hypothetical protein